MFTKTRFNDVEIIRRRKDIDLLEYNYNMNICDVLAAQGYAQICSHIDIINRYGITLFVELGMYMGGTLPHVIPNLELDEKFSYIGFEIISDAVKPRIKSYAGRNPRCHVVLSDMFESVGYVADSIKSAKGPAYVFCDGTNKPKELATFAPLLRVGDIISVHDYTDDQSGEIKDRDMEFMKEDFLPLDEQWRKYILWLPTFIRVK